MGVEFATRIVKCGAQRVLEGRYPVTYGLAEWILKTSFLGDMCIYIYLYMKNMCIYIDTGMGYMYDHRSFGCI